MRIYTRTGDDGTTGLLYGGRVRKDDPLPSAYGDVDEAQATLGVVRAHNGNVRLDATLVSIQRDLWVLMAELATAPENRERLEPGASLVTPEMVERLERLIDEISARFEPPTEFVVPGQTVLSAHLDVARTVVRRAERSVLAAAAPGSSVGPYLNRLSDLLWTMARAEEGESLPTRSLSAPDVEADFDRDER
ncbi:MAG: cob(I)yrinic acid a,c-diamide adenosyltransferase [Acidobacteria bacterium]|nr:cob(I)yrinic acid a,c-diamide adenosyltransferase [Acidobacteriota bacterium]